MEELEPPESNWKFAVVGMCVCVCVCLCVCDGGRR